MNRDETGEKALLYASMLGDTMDPVLHALLCHRKDVRNTEAKSKSYYEWRLYDVGGMLFLLSQQFSPEALRKDCSFLGLSMLVDANSEVKPIRFASQVQSKIHPLSFFVYSHLRNKQGIGLVIASLARAEQRNLSKGEEVH